MKLSTLRAAVAAIPSEYDDVDVKVWLPGSRIALGTSAPAEKQFMLPSHAGVGAILIEGNVEPGSALAG